MTKFEATAANKLVTDAIMRTTGSSDCSLRIHFVALSIASDIDKLAENLESNSRDMAERFARFADEVKADGCVRYDSTPCGYSTLADIERDAAKNSALWSALHAVVNSFGKDGK